MRGLLSERPSSLSSYERRFVDAAHTAGRLALGYRDTRKAMAFYGILARDPIDIGPRPHALLRQARRRQQRPQVYKVLTESLRRELEDEKAEPLPETTVLLQKFTRPGRGSW